MPQFILSQIPEAVFEGKIMGTEKEVFSYSDQFNFSKLRDIKYYIDRLDNLLPKWLFTNDPSHYLRQAIEQLLKIYEQIYQECIRVNRENINRHERIDDIKNQIKQRSVAIIEQCEVDAVDGDLNVESVDAMVDVLNPLNKQMPRSDNIRHHIYFARENLDKLIPIFREFQKQCIQLNETNIRLKIADLVLSQQLYNLELAEFAEIAGQESSEAPKGGDIEESIPPLEEQSFSTDSSPGADTNHSVKRGKFLAPGMKM